jgi:hypothetical protein
MKKKNRDRVWTNLEVPCDNSDQDLFNASTETVGDGKISLFWSSIWIKNKAAKNIAPNLLLRLFRRKKNYC